jgi:hypothetical protein
VFHEHRIRELLEAKPFHPFEIIFLDGKTSQFIENPEDIEIDGHYLISDDGSEFSIIPFASMSWIKVFCPRKDFLVERWRRTGKSPEGGD